MVVVFATYIAILVITSVYFVPELKSIISTPFSQSVDAALTQRAHLWEALSLVRLFVLLGMALYLLEGLTKPGTKWKANSATVDATALPAGKKLRNRPTMPVA
jgi:hypothetical protein